MKAAYVDIKDRLMRSVLLTMGFPSCHGSLYKHIRPTYPGCHRWGGMLVIVQSVVGVLEC